MITSHSREEYLRQKRKKRLIRYGIVASILLTLFIIFVYVAHRPQIRISKISLTGGVLVTEEVVGESSREFLSGSYLWLFPKNNILWYPHDALVTHLSETFRRIDTIYIERQGFDGIIIRITERKPESLWCDGEPSTSTKCFFMDSNGIIFTEAPIFSGDAYMKYYGFISNISLGASYLASTTEFVALHDFIEKTKTLSLNPLYVIGQDDNQFTLVLSGGSEIYFDTKETLSKTGDNLSALLKSPELSQNISNLEYIDLRFGNKLYYKLK